MGQSPSSQTQPQRKPLARVLLAVQCGCGLTYPLITLAHDEVRLCFSCGRSLESRDQDGVASTGAPLASLRAATV